MDNITFIYLPEVRYSANHIIISTKEIWGEEKLILYNESYAPELDLKPEKYSTSLEVFD